MKRKKKRGGSRASLLRCSERLYLTLLVVFCLLSLVLLTLNVKVKDRDGDGGPLIGRILWIGDSVREIISGEAADNHLGDGSINSAAGTKEALFLNGTGNGWNVWNSPGSILDGDEGEVDYLGKMFPAAEVLNVSEDNIVTKPWCNGLKISVEDVNLKVAFLRGRPIYVFDMGYWVGSSEDCPWCYDGIMDYDEEGVDCGGSGCKKCLKAREEGDE